MIYESPDKGKTIFVRQEGSLERTPVSFNTEDARIYKSIAEKYKEDKLWEDIRRTARTNPALQKALDNAILIYRLSKEDAL